MMDFVLVPGVWAGGWLWDDVARELQSEGHGAHPVTLSGLDGSGTGETVGLDTHVEDVRAFIASRDLDTVVLVGHSYSGIVVGQVSSRYPDLVSHTVFVEAFLPVQGRSLLEVSGLDVDEETALIDGHGGFWPAPRREELVTRRG